MAIKRIGYPEP